MHIDRMIGMLPAGIPHRPAVRLPARLPAARNPSRADSLAPGLAARAPGQRDAGRRLDAARGLVLGLTLSMLAWAGIWLAISRLA